LAGIPEGVIVLSFPICTSLETIAAMKAENSHDRHEYSDNPTQSTGFRVVQDAVHGFLRLDPIPPEAEVGEFYESRYYDLIRKGNRAPELQRLMQGGDSANQELRWLKEGLYTDIVSTLEDVAPGRRLLEVGCGTGDFLSFAAERKFEGVGTEPAFEVAQRAGSRGLTVHALTLEKFAAQSPSERFDVVVMLNVLEHMPDAVGTLQQCRQMLAPDGILCIRVPNDFSEIQDAARQKLSREPWWIAVPDHINYFNFASLRTLLYRLGFETVYAQGDFPMELFLLMGENYVGDPEVGSRCHARRVQFDLGLTPALRRKIYSALGSAGVGRDCLVFGKKLYS
jgi:2-polyprenyl-3-methyl-5-hydroxy-6-metoxy-1,4-benzoquinol methylase